MISRQLTPSSASPSRSAEVMPPTTVLERYAPRHVALRVEEDLDVARAVRRDAAQVGQGEVVEVPFRHEDGDALVVDAQEVLEAAEAILGAAFLGRGAGQRDAVAAAELEQQLGLKRALDVQVQLGLRQATQERLEGGVGEGERGGVGHGAPSGHRLTPLYPLGAIAARRAAGEGGLTLGGVRLCREGGVRRGW